MRTELDEPSPARGGAAAVAGGQVVERWRADGLRAEFGDQPGPFLLEHGDGELARLPYSGYQPRSTTMLGFHAVRHVPGDPRPHLLTLDRHGSLPVGTVRAVLAELGFGLAGCPQAGRRLQLRDCRERWWDR